jgi:hypothetical protein
MVPVTAVPGLATNCKEATRKRTCAEKIVVAAKACVLLLRCAVKAQFFPCFSACYIVAASLATVACEAPVSSSEMEPPSYSEPAPASARDAAVSTNGKSDAGVSVGDAGSGSSTEGVDPVAVLESIARGGYATSSAFTRVTAAPYESAAAAGTMVSEWVSSFALNDYLAIAPEVTGSGATVPPGTTIVRAVLGEDGGVGKLTVMTKGPPGFNAALGDWWFAVTDPDGLPLEEDGGAEMGKLSGCYSCHVPRSGDGYLFGVPLTDRSVDASVPR